MAYDFAEQPNTLDDFWMPFTPQRDFKHAPRMLVRAEGMYYYDEAGRAVLDGAGGMWCVNAGHNAARIREAITEQLDTLDYATCFKMGHPMAFRAASRLVNAMPEGLDRVFFSNSGSEAVDTALKIALAYQRARSQPQRRILIGRERAYHGVGFGGMSVGGITDNRRAFGQLLPDVDHLSATLDLEHNAFSRGCPAYGAHFADELEDLAQFHGPENIAAVIVEPVAGSTGLLPPPEGYLKRLREICDRHDILLIFDEVVTAFGRFGSISSIDYFGVTPDMITCAKGLTNGTVPMGATFVSDAVYQAFMQGDDHTVELCHGYTYSGHPLASAAAIAALDTYSDDGIFDNAASIMPKWQEAIHTLDDKPGVIDVRDCGVLGAVQLAPGPDDDRDKPGRDTFVELFNRGVTCRLAGNTVIFSPPLILDETHIDKMVGTLGEILSERA